MKHRFFIIFFLLNSACYSALFAGQHDLIEQKIGLYMLKIDKAFQKKKWSLAIKYGEKALNECQKISPTPSPRYLTILKKINEAYDKTGRLLERANEVKKAYILSFQILGAGHSTTLKSKALYSKLLIRMKKYEEAIPLVQENINLYRHHPNKNYLTPFYMMQLYSLYALTHQYDKEAETILSLLELNTHLFGHEDAHDEQLIQDLAQNYCHQKKYVEFEKLMKQFNLKYVC